MRGLQAVLAQYNRRITDLERRQRSQNRTGNIVQVDAGNGTARVRLEDNGADFLTDWLPWVEIAAGQMRTHIPPSVGQQVTVVSESGDLTDAVIHGSVNSTANARPSSAADEYVLFSVGDASIRISGGGSQMEFKVGDSTLTMTASGVVVQAARIDLN